MNLTQSCRVLLICLVLLSLNSAGASSQRKKTIAVLDPDLSTVDLGLADRAYGGKRNLARRIADKLITSLVALKTCQVIERSQLERVLREENVEINGRIDPSTLAKLGRILGVDAIFIGNVSVFELRGLPKDNLDTMWNPKDMSARIAVNFRIVDTTTGVIEVSNEVTGQSAQGSKTATNVRISQGILGSKIGGNQGTQVKDEQIRDVVQQTVDEVIGGITLNTEKYLSGNLRPPEPAITADKLLNGRVISVSGPSLVIANVNKSSVRVGDRLFVRRFKAVLDPVTGKETKFSEKIGEVEVVEIQEDVIIVSFSGSGMAQIGDAITNSPNGQGITATTTPTPKAGKAGLGGLAGGKIIGDKINGRAPTTETSTNQTSKHTPTETCPTCASMTGQRSSPTERIERYPVIDCPDTVVVANQFVVQVSLALLRPKILPEVKDGQSTPTGGISMELPRQTKQAPWKIDVVLSAPDFDFVDGKNAQTINLPLLEKSSIALFKLNPKQLQQLPMPSEINATLWHGGNFLGQISRTVTITRNGESGDLAPKKSNPSEQKDGDSSQAAPGLKELQDRLQQLEFKLPPIPAEPGPTKLSEQSDAATPGQSAKAAAPTPPGTAQRPDPLSPVLMLDPERKSPDLTILIKERFNKRVTGQMEIQIHSPHLQTTTSIEPISPEVALWLEAKFKEFAEKSGRDLKVVEAGTTYEMRRYTDAMMVGFGRELYKKIAPRVFKTAFWSLQDTLKDKFTSIQIISDNPTIPWELMIPVRDSGNGERGFFLGERFKVGRWHLPEGISPAEAPPQAVSVNRLSVIAPNYTGELSLRHQSEEVKVLGQLPGYQPVTGRIREVQELFANRPQGIIHFAGHGGNLRANSKINDYAILLEDGSLNVQTWQGLTPQRLSAHPFLFFNACHIGQAQRVANFVNGWAPALLEAGASGYIGALWPINDRGAYEFAKLFYETLDAELKRGPVSVAEVVRRTRQAFLTKSDPTFLAYIYYGDPNLTFYSQQPPKQPAVNRKKP